MAEYNIQMNRYLLASDSYDQLFPKTKTIDVVDQDNNTLNTLLNNKQDSINVSGILKGDGAGGISAAVAGTDYVNSNQAIRYDAAQSLTNTQKKQARRNISSLNGQSLYIESVGGQIGWYRITEPFAQYGTSGYLTVSHEWSSGGPSELLLGVSSAPDAHGKLQCLRSAGQSNSVPFISNARLVKIADTYVLDLYVSGTGRNDCTFQICNCSRNPITLITPTFISADDTLPDGETLAAVMEYQNPPMLLGVEYKTTERYLGKPVYVKTINFGALPDSTTKSVSTGYAVGEIMPLSITGHFYVGEDRHTIPYGEYFSSQYVHFTNFNSDNVIIKTNFSASNFTAYVTIKFTKDAD